MNCVPLLTDLEDFSSDPDDSAIIFEYILRIESGRARDCECVVAGMEERKWQWNGNGNKNKTNFKCST